ncbi:hypothetical protein [Streptomyces yangpuensis]|uniref:hypothetical protein n=1 Tax=Streptomyces yangpuensis TaxID=1648182 RepID=UPI0036542C1F
MHEMRLIDPENYTVNAEGAIRRGVPAAEVEIVRAELMALAETDAEQARELHLDYAACTPDRVGAEHHRAEARRIRATRYRVKVTPALV